MTVSYLFGQIVGCAIGALLGALTLKVATRVAAGFWPPYWEAYRATLAAIIVSVVLGFLSGAIVGSGGLKMDASAVILVVVICFFAQALIYSAMLKVPGNVRIPFNCACLLSLFQLLIGVVILAAFAFIIWGFSVISNSLVPSNQPDDPALPLQSDAVVQSPQLVVSDSSTSSRSLSDTSTPSIEPLQKMDNRLGIPSATRVWTGKDGRTLSAAATEVDYERLLVTFTRWDGKIFPNFSIDLLGEFDQILLLGRQSFEEQK